jgi:hypothetical protein
MLTRAPSTPLADICAAKHELFLANRAGMPNADPCRYYLKIVPRELEMQEQAAAEFGKLNGWRKSSSAFGLGRIPGCTMAYPHFGYRRDVFDHVLYFRKNRRPAALAVQPYTDAGLSCIDQAQEIADQLGLALHIPPAPKASIHLPGGTVFLVFTNRDHVIKWLPEMISGVDRAGRMQRYRIVGRPT